MMKWQDWQQDVTKIRNQKILLIGDIGLDEYILGQVQRISPEAPVPVVEVDSQDFRLGLSGNVAQNIQSLGGEATLMSVVGCDSSAEKIHTLLAGAGVRNTYLIEDEDRPTTRKARVMVKNHHVVRVDFESRHNLSQQTEARVLAQLQKIIGNFSVVICEDYAKGFVTPGLMAGLQELKKKHSFQLLVDPHRSNPASFYLGCDLLKPNFDEALALSGLTYDEIRHSPDRILDVGHALLKQCGAKQLVMTRGKDGMTIFSAGEITQVPTFARDVFDVTGAGDTVIATLALATAAGLPLVKGALLANVAAGIVVAKIGCVPCPYEELTTSLKNTFSQ